MVERLNVIRVIVDSIPSSRLKLNANVAKLAYARDLKSLALKGYIGSSPIVRTKKRLDVRAV